MILRFRLASTTFIPSTKTAMSSSTSSTFSLLNQLDAHLAATSSTSTSNPTFTQTRHISSAITSSTPTIKRQRATDRPKIHSTSSVTTDDDDVPLSISRPLSSKRTNLNKKSKPSSGSSDIEEVFLKPHERLSKSKSKGKGKAKENDNHVIVVPSSSDLENECRPDYESWTLTALQVSLIRNLSVGSVCKVLT